MADLRAGADIIDRLYKMSGKRIYFSGFFHRINLRLVEMFCTENCIFKLQM